jgi:hypothetical protein
VPPKQPIPPNRRTAKCVPPPPVVRREQDQPELKRDSALVVEDSPPDLPPKVAALGPDELAALRTFFELLSQWDESPEGEIEHE